MRRPIASRFAERLTAWRGGPRASSPTACTDYWCTAVDNSLSIPSAWPPAERRDEAERAGDLEQAAELSRKPNVHLGPQAYRAGDLEREGRGEKKRGFGCGHGWSRTIRRFGRSGTASSSGSRRGSRGSIGSFRRSRVSSNARFLRPRPQLALVYRIQQAPAPRRSPPRCPSVARDQGLDSQQKAWSGLVKPGRPWPCFAPRGSRGHFMDNEDTRVPTVHIEIGGPMIESRSRA